MAADQNLKIVVACETAAAQKAIDDLSSAELGLAKASDRAGDAVKRTAQEVAEATAKQNAAREAAQRAAKALAEHTAITQAFGKDSAEAAASLARLKAAQDAAETAARTAERALEGAAKAVAETARNADDKATPALRRMKSQLETAGKSAEATASDLRALEARIESVGGAAKGMGAALSSFVGNLAANAVSSLAGRLADVGVHALSTAANFERMKTALTTTLGGTQEAAAAFEQLQGFAAATPYSLEEVTNGFLKLKARGLDGSERALRAWGDTASAMGKTLDDMVEAVADASTGEFERLKEFGIQASSQGDKVAITFRGVTTTVAKEARAIEAELMRLGEVNFAGGMEAMSKTLGGRLSTIKDGFDQFIVGVMDSGITDALKSIMSSFSGMGETGALLGDVLGVTLGGAFTVLSGTVKVATTAIELFSTAVNFILTPVHAVKDAVKSLADDAMTSIVVEAEKAAAAQRDLDAAYWESAKGSGTLAADMQGLIDLSGKYALSIAAEGLAHLEAANAADRRMKAEADLWAKLEARNAKAEDKAIEEDFFAANEMGPQLPPGFKREKKKGKKKQDLSGQGMEAAKRYEMETRREREQAFAAEVAAFDAESAIREKKIAGIGREIAALEAQGVAQRDQVDVLLWSISIESEAEAKREALIDARIAKEEELARFQVRAARTEEQREKARTRLEEAQHQARLRVLQRTAAAEEREHAKRARVVEGVAEAVMTLGEGMLDAFEKMAAGQRGAIAEMLADQLKSIARTHSVLALGETAKGIAATAMTWGIPNPEAGAHFAAAAVHGAVAVAAGVGAYAAGQVVDIPQGGGKGGDAGGGSGSTGGGRGSGSRSKSDDGDLEAQEVPVSHEQLRRADGRVARGDGGGVVVNIYNPTIAGAGGVKEFAAVVQREIERNNRGGNRPRF